MSRGRSRTRCTGRCATSSTCPTSTPPTTTSSTATLRPSPSGARPLAPFTAQRIDYSLARLAHYTATSPTHFQNHVLFTNYQFYMDEFVEYALQGAGRPGSGYTALRRARQRRGHPRGPDRRADRAAAADAGLPPGPAAAFRHLDGQHRRRAVEREDDHRPHRGAAPARLADGRALRGPAELAVARRLRPRARLHARGPRARRRPAGLGADPAARRGAGGAGERGGRGDRARGLRAEEDHAHRHGRDDRQPQLGARRPVAGRWRGSPRRGRSRSTWRARRSPPTASASGCPTGRCSASATSRCTAS